MKLYHYYRRLNRAWLALFPPKFDQLQVDFHRLQNNPQVSAVSLIQSDYEVELVTGGKFMLRANPSSDVQVFEQIFGLKEYLPVVGLIKHGLQGQDFIMIDGGANIGMASCYFASQLAISKLFLVEPLSSNYDRLMQNLNIFGLDGLVRGYPKAISSSSTDHYDISFDFRDGKDWSASVVPQSDGAIESISIMDIITENRLDYVSYLKLDIEGAERFVFQIGADLTFLDFVKIISIEIHDEFAIRDVIYKSLKNKGFLLFESGEMTIGFKPDCLIVAKK